MKPFSIAFGWTIATALASAPAPWASQDVPKPVAKEDMSGLHDFDFLVGEWRVHSRRLKDVLAGSHDWYEFDGTIRSWPLMEGRANPAREDREVGVRAGGAVAVEGA